MLVPETLSLGWIRCCRARATCATARGKHVVTAPRVRLRRRLAWAGLIEIVAGLRIHVMAMG
jgi:hypothetical protein